MARKSIRQISDSWPSPEFLDLKPEPFSPYVFIVTSSQMPSSIAMCAVAGGGMKTLLLPPGTTADDLPKVQEAVRDHYRQNDGSVILFGRTTGYLFVVKPDEGILLDTDGKVVGKRTGTFYPISISIQDRL